jgi:hypothetical protein
MRYGVIALALVAASCAEGVIVPGDVLVAEVATSSALDGWAVNYPKQRKVLFMAGRLWVFYADGSDTLARSTADGSSFSEPQLVREGMVFGHRCGFAFDGAFVHYACCEALAGSDVLYRRGEPHEDGTITWDAEQVAFEVPPLQSVLYPKVLVDAESKPWVAFMLFEGGFETAPQSAIVTRSIRADGVWETAPEFPFVLVSDSTETYPDPVGVALSRGGTYWVYDLDGEQTYRGRPWTPAAGWGTEEQVSTTRHSYALFDAAAEGDSVHVAYYGDGVRHRARGTDGRWGPETEIGAGSGHVSIAALGGDRAMITWLDLDGERVLQREVGAGGSGSPLLVMDAGDEGLAGARLGINLNGLAAPAGPFLSAITTTVGQAAPYRVLLATRPESTIAP